MVPDMLLMMYGDGESFSRRGYLAAITSPLTRLLRGDPSVGVLNSLVFVWTRRVVDGGHAHGLIPSAKDSLSVTKVTHQQFPGGRCAS